MKSIYTIIEEIPVETGLRQNIIETHTDKHCAKKSAEAHAHIVASKINAEVVEDHGFNIVKDDTVLAVYTVIKFKADKSIL